MKYSIHQLAELAGVSVRTLHYYDEIGLLVPQVDPANHYRQYHEADALKLQQILFFRELEFSLEQIKEIVNNPQFDRISALLDQKKLLEMKRERLLKLVETIDKTMNSQKGGEKMSNDDLFGSFNDDQIEEYKEEAKQRWGHTEAYKQSVERTKHWTKEDYKRVEKEGKDLTKAIGKNMEKGAASPEVQELIEKHYQYIAQFYDLPYEMYQNLGTMYVEDPRFTAYYEEVRPGLAVFMAEAISAYVKTKQSK